MSEDAVLYGCDDGTARLTINRPDRRNALGPDVVAGLLDGLRRAEEDESARVLVLTGAGEKAFCAGGDLGNAPPPGVLDRRAAHGRFIELVDRLQRLRMPTIARVRGHAMGGGIGVVLACDMAIAAEEARLGTPEVDIGLFPMMVLALLFRHVGRKRGLEMIFTGERLTAAEAASLGIINRAVPAAELDAAVDALADRVKSKSPAVLRLGREAYYETADLPMRDALPRLRDYLGLNAQLEDAAEGIMAFLQKRPPEWKGR